MPKGIKIIAATNIFFACVFLANQFLMEKAQLSYPFSSYINFVSAAGLGLVAFVVLFRMGGLVGFVRLLIYVLALVLGLQALLSIKFLFSYYGTFTIVVDAVVIFYMIGLRGYLASKDAEAYFTGTKSSQGTSD